MKSPKDIYSYSDLDFELHHKGSVLNYGYYLTLKDGEVIQQVAKGKTSDLEQANNFIFRLTNGDVMQLYFYLKDFIQNNPMAEIPENVKDDF